MQQHILLVLFKRGDRASFADIVYAISNYTGPIVL